MTHTDVTDLGARLRDLVPPMAPPPDLMSELRPRVRKQRMVRSSWLAATAAVATAVVVMVPAWIAGPSGLPASTVGQYLTVSDAAPVRYTGPAIPDSLKGVTLWLVGQRVTGQSRLAIVSYTHDGHPCLGSIDVGPPLVGSPKIHGSGFTGSCSFGDKVDTYSYEPYGSKGQWGPDALLYGTVPANVRIVAATVIYGQLTQRYTATVATPADTVERFFVFDSPSGATHGIDVHLTYYDARGAQVGTRHVKSDPSIRPAPISGCPAVSTRTHDSASSCATIPACVATDAQLFGAANASREAIPAGQCAGQPTGTLAPKATARPHG